MKFGYPSFPSALKRTKLFNSLVRRAQSRYSFGKQRMMFQRHSMRSSNLVAAVTSFWILLSVSPAKALQCGQASWYGPGLYGNRTSSGEVFRPGTLTAAHRSLPLGTWVQVVNRDNGRTVNVRINDRGPFVGGRIIDIAHGAAGSLGLIASGTANVCISRI